MKSKINLFITGIMLVFFISDAFSVQLKPLGIGLDIREMTRNNDADRSHIFALRFDHGEIARRTRIFSTLVSYKDDKFPVSLRLHLLYYYPVQTLGATFYTGLNYGLRIRDDYGPWWNDFLYHLMPNAGVSLKIFSKWVLFIDYNVGESACVEPILTTGIIWYWNKKENRE